MGNSSFKGKLVLCGSAYKYWYFYNPSLKCSRTICSQALLWNLSLCADSSKIAINWLMLLCYCCLRLDVCCIRNRTALSLRATNRIPISCFAIKFQITILWKLVVWTPCIFQEVAFSRWKAIPFQWKKDIFQNMDETLSLIYIKIELLCLKYLHLKEKGERLKLFGSECKIYLEHRTFSEGFKIFRNS